MCSTILTFFQQTFLLTPSVCLPKVLEASNPRLNPIWHEKAPRKLQNRFELTLSGPLEFQHLSMLSLNCRLVQVHDLPSSHCPQQLHQLLPLHCFLLSHTYPYLFIRIKSTVLIHCLCLSWDLAHYLEFALYHHSVPIHTSICVSDYIWIFFSPVYQTSITELFSYNAFCSLLSAAIRVNHLLHCLNHMTPPIYFYYCIMYLGWPRLSTLVFSTRPWAL